MDEKLTQKLTKIVYRSLAEEPESVSFQLLEDIKSFWSQTARVVIHWSCDKDLHTVDNHGRLKYPPKLFIKVSLQYESTSRFQLPSISTNISDIETENELEDDLRILWNVNV